jgi:hypothetical protein
MFVRSRLRMSRMSGTARSTRFAEISSTSGFLFGSYIQSFSSIDLSDTYKTTQTMTSSSSLDREKAKDDILPGGHIEHAGSLVDTVDDVTEKRLLRKLDYRIIPMIMWSKSPFAWHQHYCC